MAPGSGASPDPPSCSSTVSGPCHIQISSLVTRCQADASPGGSRKWMRVAAGRSPAGVDTVAGEVHVRTYHPPSGCGFHAERDGALRDVEPLDQVAVHGASGDHAGSGCGFGHRSSWDGAVLGVSARDGSVTTPRGCPDHAADDGRDRPAGTVLDEFGQGVRHRAGVDVEPRPGRRGHRRRGCPMRSARRETHRVRTAEGRRGQEPFVQVAVAVPLRAGDAVQRGDVGHQVERRRRRERVGADRDRTALAQVVRDGRWGRVR